jgi:hypothetical protein
LARQRAATAPKLVVKGSVMGLGRYCFEYQKLPRRQMLCQFMRPVYNQEKPRGSLMKSILVAIYAIWAPYAVLAAGQSDETDATASFNDWSAFFEEDSCWIATQPGSRGEVIHEEVFLFVAFQKRLALPEISLHTTQEFVDSTVTLGVDDQTFELIVRDDTAFSIDDDGLVILKHFLAGDHSTVTFQLSGLDKMSGPISASGFRDAYNFLSRNCDFRFVPYMSEELGVEPA